MLPPHQWQPVHFANVGTDERFVNETLELLDVLNGSLILGNQREAVNHAIVKILTDGLIPTFLELRAIREMRAKEMPMVDRFQPYEDFARKLWKSYKDLTQRGAAAMGFNIGFLFQKEKDFEEGLTAFREENSAAPPNLEEYLREVRRRWQNDLSQFRNGFVEHQEGRREDYRKFYNPDFVESLFAVVPRAIADTLVVLMNLRMPPGVCVIEHRDELHGPGWPDRFRFWVAGFPPTERT